ncbi:MAG: hypothetical protein ACRDTT_25195, partial [Pseudonocardiaceae bacterium]
MSRRNLGNRLYSGEASLPIVAHSKRWYTISAVLMLIAIGAVLVRGGLQLGVEFTGGAELTAQVAQTSDSTVPNVRDAVIATGIEEAAEPRVVVVGDDNVRIHT